MNKYENKLAFSVLTTLISGIALIYTLIMYHTIIFAVMGMSLLFLICAYILTQNIIAFNIAKSKDMNNQLKEYINDISSQLETMNGTQTQLGKATFLYTKQAARAVSMLENNYTESQDALYKNLASITNMQNKATKLMIKFDQSNTTKVISSIKDLRNQLSDTMIQGFDQIQPNNSEVIGALEDIVEYLKSQPVGPDQTLSLQLNNVAHELQNISNNIQQFQLTTQSVAPTVQVQTSTVQEPSVSEVAVPEANILQENIPEPTMEVADIEEAPTEIADVETSITETANIEETLIPDETLNEIDDLLTSLDETLVDTPIQETTNADTEKIVAEEPVVENITPVTEDSNKQLSADEIAALFAAADPTPKREVTPIEAEPVSEQIEEEEPFTPTFTVVGKSDEYIEEPKIATIGDLGEDSNKQLSADEIAALFAAADPSPKKEEKPVQATAPVSEDPNKQLSADEIAALFAAADPAPKKDTVEEEKAVNEPITKAEPVNVTPVSDDPNKQLSADEIAALFASMG